jgi:hypothetical protein
MTPSRMLTLWVVYDHPPDFPDHVVVRRQFVTQHSTTPITSANIGGVYDTLNDARADIPLGHVCIGRFPDDDPVIVETWI